MTEPVMSLIDNHHEKQNSESDQSFRRIEFHIAKKPFTGFSNKGDDVGFRAESLNPSTSSSIKSVGGGSSGKKRDASEMENGLDQELTFGITFRRIGAGLENLGNTCFLNSVLQCLTYTEPLAAYLQSGKHQVTCRKSGFCALCSIQKHVNRALQLSGRSLAPKDLVSNLRCISRTFRNSRQEDAHEYMVNLLESMHKCCLPNGVPIESQSAYDKSLVHKIFGGQLRSQVKCMQCNYCSNKFDPFMDLSLEIFKVDTLYKAFANFTAKEQLDGGARQYQCQQCKQKVKALKQLTVYKAPNVLTVHLKRFGCYMSGEKINKKVHFGPTLDLKPFVTGPYDGDLKYTLYGVLVHAGWNMHSGHYYCFVRTSSGMWYSLDDNRVFQVSEKKVFEQKAYMLFYFRDRKNFSSKKTTNANKKETVMMNGETSGLCVPTEAQIKTGLSNLPLNAQTSLKNTADGAHQKENIGMDGTPDRPGASREAQMKTDLRQGNGSLNAHADVAQQKENIGMNGTPDRSGAPREAQMTTDLSKRNGSLNANADAAHQTENIGMNGTPDGPGAAREAQINTDLRKCNGSFAHADVAYQEENIGMNGTPDRPGAPREAQMNTDPSKGNGSLNAHISLATVSAERSLASPVAPKETQTKTILSDYGYSNDDKSLVSVSTLNCSGATKKTQMEIGLSDGLLGSQKCLDAVGIEGTGSDPVAPKEIQTNSSLMNGSLSGLESSAIPTTLTDGFSTGASELERTQTKETSVPESISEPGKTENHTKEIGGGESSGGNDGGEGYVEPATALLKISGLPEKESYMEKKALGGKTHNTELSDLPKMDSCMKKKASMRKPLKKTKNLFKGKSISMKFSSTVFMGASLNQRKKKKHKRNKRVKNLAQEILVNESSSSLVKIEAQETAKPAVDNVFKVRLVEAGAVLATRDPNTGSHLNSDKSNLVDISRRSLSQKELVHMLTSGIDDRIVLRWDEDESAPSQIFREKQNNFTIGHVGDQWDEEYDRGKRKKVKISKTEFGGKNTFQVIANERLNLHSEKQNLSKLLQSSSKMPAATKTKRKNNHFQKPRACKGPYRI